MKKYIVKLTDEEKEQLHALTHKGACGVRKLRRAQILLSANQGLTDERIAQVLDAGVRTVERVRRRFVEEGIEEALSERPRPGAQRKLDGHQEAYLVALACSDPPGETGKKRWSMQMLADKLVEIEVVDEISDETVRRTLKKGMLSRG